MVLSRKFFNMTIPKEILELLERLNGSNVIITDSEGRILTFRAKYGAKQRMIPGGKLERNELPQYAGQSECEEETGLYPEFLSLKLVASFMQRIAGLPNVRGFNFLFVSDKYQGGLQDSNESEDLKFMNIEEIIQRKDEFQTSYIRMILYYWKWKQDGIVRITRLVEPITVDVNGKAVTV